MADQKSNTEQIRQVYDWLMAGASTPEVIEAIQSEFPGVDPQYLVYQAAARIQEDGSKPAEQITAWATAATLHLYAKFLKIGDYAGALKCVQQVAQLAEKRRPQQADEPDIEEYDYLAEEAV